jgi:heme A synthase
VKLNSYAKYAWGVLTFNVFVIVWGAFVRATGSGAGCGAHWPLCNGEVVPRAPATETIIEFSHRLTSGLAFLLVLGMLVWAFRAYPKGHIVRTGAKLSMGFMVLETLVGASLVIFGWVAGNISVTRAFVMGIHLINTFLLMGAITLTAWWASGGQSMRLKGHGKLGLAIGVGFLGMLLLGASGGVTALGDTLFPASSLAEGIREEFSSTAHFLVRLRVYHPLIAIGVGAYFIAVMAIFNSQRGTASSRLLAKLFTGVFVTQLIIGSFNVVLLAPVWIQLVHLFISDILLIVQVLFIAVAFGQPVPQPQPVDLANVPSPGAIR